MFKINGHVVTPTIFPDKTSQVWKLSPEVVDSVVRSPEALIEWEFENEAELIHIYQLVNLIKISYNVKYITLNMPYLPYGRQDKEISNESTFALATFCALVSFIADKVVTLDAHSDFVEQNCYGIFEYINEKPTKEIAQAMKFGPDLLCFPDKGALERYKWVTGVPAFYGEKDRDQATGHINGYKLQDGIDISDKKVLVIDDICDGGATFCILAESLKNAGASNMALYVTHGIFSKGTRVLYDAGYSQIYTRNGLVGA